MRDEIVIRLNAEARPGWQCPNCGGWGHMNDGSSSLGPDEVRSTPSTKCWVCNGKGRVLVSAIPDEKSVTTV